MFIPNDFQLAVLQQRELTKNLRLKPSFLALEHVLSMPSYWLEVGATICVLPRQVGKTTLAIHLAETLPNATFVTGIKNRHNINVTRPNITNSSERHLIVDEYQMLDKNKLTELLETRWSSVLLIGSHIS